MDRYHADPRALAAIEADYQTSGRLDAPLVTLHTTADPIVPYWHEPLYSVKALASSGLLHANLPVFRYGHCSFKAEEALVALGLLVLEGRGPGAAERRARPDDGVGPAAVPVAGEGQRPAALTPGGGPSYTPPMKLITIALIVSCPVVAAAEIHRHGGSADALPHDKYVRVVSEADSPVQQTYVKTKDGLYVAAAIRKPKGDGPFPAIILFHGAPGGRGMEQLVGLVAGSDGGPGLGALPPGGLRRRGGRLPRRRLERSERALPPAEAPPPSTTASR